MRQTSVGLQLWVALALSLGVTSCALPSREARRADHGTARGATAATSRPAEGLPRSAFQPDASRPRVSSRSHPSSSVWVEADRLAAAGDDRGLLEFVSNKLPSVRTRSVRASLELMTARAQLRLGRKLSALTSYGRAWQEASPDAFGVGGEILVEWADLELAVHAYESAMDHYTLALGARGLTHEQERALRTSLVVACEAAGHSAMAAKHLALLDRDGRDQLPAVRSRLMDSGRRGARLPRTTVADAYIPHGIIPINPALLLPGIRTREEWGAAKIRADHVPMTPITSITVHHSAMPAPSSYGTVGQLKQIQDIHTQDKGWADVGYHFLIDPTGRVWEGRRLMYQGAHAGGAANIGNVGVCLLGNFENHNAPQAQLEGLSSLVEALRGQFDIAKSEVRTHREWKATACPGAHLHSAVLGYRSGASATLSRQ